MSAGNEGLRDTDQDWRLIAAKNPYWGVLSLERYKGNELADEDLAAFYETGSVFANNLIAFIRKHILPDFAPARSLDFGCGVGRLLAAFAKLSQHAVGVDIAPQMLELARRNLGMMGIDNVDYVLGDDTLSQVDGDFDLINTYIVLQHIPPTRGYRMIQLLLDRLRRGGCASIQLTYGKDRQFLHHEIGLAVGYRRDGNVITDLVPRRDALPDGNIMMFDYDLNQIMAMVAPIAGHPMLVLPTFDDKHFGVHLIFARQ